MELIEILKFSLISAIITLDERNIGNFGVSRPIVSGFIFGSLTDNFILGIYCGLMVEMFTIIFLPVGNFIPPSGSIITAITIFLSNKFINNFNSLFPIIFFYSLSMGNLVRRITAFIWRVNNYHTEAFFKRLKNGKINFLRFNIESIFVSIIFFSIFTFISIFLGKYFMNFLLVNVLNNFLITNIMKEIIKYLPILGLSMFLKIYDIPPKIYIIILGAFFAAFSTLFIKDLKIVLLISFLISSIVIFIISRISLRFKIWKILK